MDLLLVDDERPIREHVKMLLQGADYQVHEAQNGEMALQVLKQHSIDIMLTDIRMPRMDGIDLIKRCRVAYPELLCVVLSNYAEFSLAQSALRYGAKNYILKATMTKETLQNELTSILQDQDAEKRKFDNNEMVSIRNMLFLERLSNTISQRELIRRSQKHGITIFNDCSHPSMFALLRLEQFQKWAADPSDQQFDLAVFATMNVLDELVTRENGKNAIFHLFGDLFLLTDFDEADTASHMAKMKGIQRSLKDYLNIGASMICGYRFDSFERLFQLAKESKADLNQLFYCPGEIVLVQDELNRGENQKEIDLYFHFQDLIRNDHDLFSIRQLPVWITLFFNLIKQTKRNSDVVKNDLLYLIRFIEQRGFGVDNRLKEQIERMPVNRLDDYYRLFHDWMMNNQLHEVHRFEIIKAIQYIHEHYQEKITIDDISQHVNMSRSHFSKIFKEYQRKTIIEYIENYRMNQARLLLRTSPLTVTEVAEQVGIPDIYYFSKIYKRFFKTNPSMDRQAGP